MPHRIRPPSTISSLPQQASCAVVEGRHARRAARPAPTSADHSRRGQARLGGRGVRCSLRGVQPPQHSDSDDDAPVCAGKLRPVAGSEASRPSLTAKPSTLDRTPANLALTPCLIQRVGWVLMIGTIASTRCCNSSGPTAAPCTSSALEETAMTRCSEGTTSTSCPPNPSA